MSSSEAGQPEQVEFVLLNTLKHLWQTLVCTAMLGSQKQNIYLIC